MALYHYDGIQKQFSVAFDGKTAYVVKIFKTQSAAAEFVRLKIDFYPLLVSVNVLYKIGRASCRERV